MNFVNVSICIPAYKNAGFLNRLLDSIAIQAYKDYEVIITDDSPDDEVKTFVSNYSKIKNLRYFKNTAQLGTPKNWNEGISKAMGSWIKIMHDDDWFVDENSLQTFIDVTNERPTATVVYSAYVNIENGRTKSISARPALFRRIAFKLNPFSIVSTNFIGPPSVVLHKNNAQFVYDDKLKWLVDLEFYARYFEASKMIYCKKALLNIGINDQQVTKASSLIPEVEIPEYLYFLNKHGVRILKNWLVYDSYWRLVRNFKIKGEDDIFNAGFNGEIPKELLSIIRLQKNIPSFILHVGVLSKLVMFVKYLLFRV